MEQEAIRLATSSDEALKAVGYGLTALGFFAGVIHRRGSRLEIDRAPYFFFLMVLVFMILFAKISLLGILDALAGSFLWAVVLGNILVMLAAGYGSGALSVWRARSAFDNWHSAFLGLVPLLNLVLIFARPRETSSAMRIEMPRVTRGILGVFLGVLIPIGGAIVSATVDRQLEQTASSPAELRKLAQRGDLENVLAFFAASAQQALPIEMDEATTMTAIRADGATISRDIVVDIPNFELTARARDFLDEAICNNTLGSVLIERGAVYEDTYFTSDGRKLGAHCVDRDVCALVPTT